MRDPHCVGADEPQVAAPANSQAPTAPSSRIPALLDDPDQTRNGLDLRSEVPLHVRPVLTYAELAALGIAHERTLRRLVATGRVKRAVLRVGRRVRFVVADLLDELRQGEG